MPVPSRQVSSHFKSPETRFELKFLSNFLFHFPAAQVLGVCAKDFLHWGLVFSTHGRRVSADI